MTSRPQFVNLSTQSLSPNVFYNVKQLGEKAVSEIVEIIIVLGKIMYHI